MSTTKHTVVFEDDYGFHARHWTDEQIEKYLDDPAFINYIYRFIVDGVTAQL